MKDDNCIFCKLANGDIPTNTIYEDEKYRVILDLGPATRGHALIPVSYTHLDVYKRQEGRVPADGTGKISGSKGWD